MDKRVTLRFYDVHKLSNSVPDLRDALKDLYDIGRARERQITLNGDVIARLERLDVGNSYVTGEFTRMQVVNFPSEVQNNGVVPLSVNGPLGHGIAFRFRISDSLLAIQYEPRILAPSRIAAYILEMRSDAAYNFIPRMRSDAWERMSRSPLRKLSVAIASPAELSEIEDAGEAVAVAFRNMGRAYDSPTITAELSMGHQRGALGTTVKRMARQLFRKYQDGSVDLRKLRAVLKTEQGKPNDEINLLDEVLSEKGEINLPENDPDRSYRLRKRWIMGKMREV